MTKPTNETPIYKTTSFRAEASLEKEARDVFESQGLSVSAAITLFLEACVQQGCVPDAVIDPNKAMTSQISADSILKSTAKQLQLSDFSDPKIQTDDFVRDIVAEFTDGIFEDCFDPWLALGNKVVSLSFWDDTNDEEDECEILYSLLEDFLPEKLPYDYAQQIVQETIESWLDAQQNPRALVSDPHSVIMGNILKRSRLTMDALMQALIEDGAVDSPDGDNLNQSLGRMVESIVSRLKINRRWLAPKPKHGVSLGEADYRLVDQTISECATLHLNVDYTKYLALEHPFCNLFENVAHQTNSLVENNYCGLYDEDNIDAHEALLMDVFGTCEFRFPPKAVYDECARRYLDAMESAEPGSTAAKCLPFVKTPFDMKSVYLYSLAIDMDVRLWMELYNRDAFNAVCEAIEAGSLPLPDHPMPTLSPNCDEKTLDDNLPEGLHRGCLAGLSEEERKAAREEHFNKMSHTERERIYEFLKSRSFQVEPVNSLSDVLHLEKKERLLELGEALGIECAPELGKAEIVDKISKKLITSDCSMAFDLENRHVFEQEHLRRALAKGGRIEFTGEEALWENRGTNPCWPYANLFLSNESFTLQIPDELLSLLLDFDWSGIDARHAAKRDAIHCVEVCSDFYGIIPVDSVYEQFKRWYDHNISRVEFLGYALDDRVQGETDFRLVELSNPADDYSIHFASWKLFDNLIGFEEFVIEEELASREEYLNYLALMQCVIPKRPIPDALRDLNALEWKMSLPATIQFRNYLDARVPDGDNDYCYAERMIEGLLFADGPMFDNIDGEEYIDRLGLAYDDESFNEAYGLWRAMMASLPCWETHGWSYIEFLKMGREWASKPNGDSL